MLKLLLYSISLIIKFETSTNRQKHMEQYLGTTISIQNKHPSTILTMKIHHFPYKKMISTHNIRTGSPSTFKKTLKTSTLINSSAEISRQSLQPFPSQHDLTEATTSMTCHRSSSLTISESTIWLDSLWTTTLTSYRNRKFFCQKLK